MKEPLPGFVMKKTVKVSVSQSKYHDYGLHWGEYTEEQQSQEDESLRKMLDKMGIVKLND